MTHEAGAWTEQGQFCARCGVQLVHTPNSGWPVGSTVQKFNDLPQTSVIVQGVPTCPVRVTISEREGIPARRLDQ